MRNGTKPTPLDPHDFSWHRSFGIAAPIKYPQDYCVDIGKTMPSQNTEGYPNGCTGYTQADNATDEDDTIYKPSYHYEKTCLIEGHDDTQGCDMRNSFKAGRIYGEQALAESTDAEAMKHIRGAYYNIYDDGKTDWFDSFRSALIAHACGISVGTPWPSEWEQPNNGIVSSQFTYNGPNTMNWHNWAIKGWKDINGVPYLMAKSWQGPNYGDNGWAYFSRETINKVMKIGGSAAYISLKASPQDVVPIQIDLYQTVLLFLHRILSMLVSKPLN